MLDTKGGKKMREAKVTNVGKSSFLWTQCSLSAVRQTLCISLKLRFITSCVLRSACVQHWNLIWEQSEVCAAGSRLKHTHRFGLTFYTKMLSSRSVSSQRCCLLPYLVDKVAYVSWVGGCGAERVLVVMVEGPLIQTSDPHFDALWLQGIRLLQLAKVIVLHTHTNTQMLALQWVIQPCITILP